MFKLHSFNEHDIKYMYNYTDTLDHDFTDNFICPPKPSKEERMEMSYDYRDLAMMAILRVNDKDGDFIDRFIKSPMSCIPDQYEDDTDFWNWFGVWRFGTYYGGQSPLAECFMAYQEQYKTIYSQRDVLRIDNGMTEETHDEVSISAVEIDEVEYEFEGDLLAGFEEDETIDFFITPGVKEGHVAYPAIIPEDVKIVPEVDQEEQPKTYVTQKKDVIVVAPRENFGVSDQFSYELSFLVKSPYLAVASKSTYRGYREAVQVAYPRRYKGVTPMIDTSSLLLASRVPKLHRAMFCPPSFRRVTGWSRHHDKRIFSPKMGAMISVSSLSKRGPKFSVSPMNYEVLWDRDRIADKYRTYVRLDGIYHIMGDVARVSRIVIFFFKRSNGKYVIMAPNNLRPYDIKAVTKFHIMMLLSIAGTKQEKKKNLVALLASAGYCPTEDEVFGTPYITLNVLNTFPTSFFISDYRENSDYPVTLKSIPIEHQHRNGREFTLCNYRHCFGKAVSYDIGKLALFKENFDIVKHKISHNGFPSVNAQLIPIRWKGVWWSLPFLPLYNPPHLWVNVKLGLIHGHQPVSAEKPAKTAIDVVVSTGGIPLQF